MKIVSGLLFNALGLFCFALLLGSYVATWYYFYKLTTGSDLGFFFFYFIFFLVHLFITIFVGSALPPEEKNNI